MATDRRVVRRRWAEAGVVAAGLSAAMLSGAGAAAAAPADSGHDPSAVSSSRATASRHTQPRAAASAARGAAHPAAASRQAPPARRRASSSPLERNRERPGDDPHRGGVPPSATGGGQVQLRRPGAGSDSGGAGLHLRLSADGVRAGPTDGAKPEHDLLPHQLRQPRRRPDLDGDRWRQAAQHRHVLLAGRARSQQGPCRLVDPGHGQPLLQLPADRSVHQRRGLHRFAHNGIRIPASTPSSGPADRKVPFRTARRW